MTAVSGGARLDEAPARLNSVREPPDSDDAGRGPRSLDEIFPLRGDPNRGRQMLEAWRAFGGEMDGAVRGALGPGRSPPEIAYAIGEIVHNYFRTRGVTLTSYELRRLVAELLTQQQHTRESRGADGPLVCFAGNPASRESAWTGAETGMPEPAVPDAVFECPPSRLVTVTPRDLDPALLADVTTRVRSRLAAGPDGGLVREAVLGSIEAVLDELHPKEPLTRDRLARYALSELCGLGPLDRLWTDLSIRAVFVNGPDRVYVERNGLLEPSHERFRNQAQLEEVVGRLVRRPTSGVAAVRLRDGGEGLVVFPPAAPAGPIVALRRGEPGDATFERLIAAGSLDRPMADLLRIATRSRLNVLVVGPEGAGTTALLAAIAHDLGDARIVTLAPHREFRWPSPSKIELTVSPEAPFATLLKAGTQLRPDLLIVDAPRPMEAMSLADLLSRGMRGVVAAGRLQAMASVPSAMVDLVVRVGPARGGLFIVVSMEDATGAQLFAHEPSGFCRRTATPSFAGSVRKAGHGEALSSALR